MIDRPRASQRKTPALFLDRDGVINVDHGYVHRIEQFEFIPGIFELARFAVQELRWPIVVVTNQAGIGRGVFDEAAYRDLTNWMCSRFQQERATIARVYHCPFHPDHGVGDYKRDHDWRKPKPGMILQAAADLGLDVPRSVLIGDKVTDMEAAAAAGIALRVCLVGSANPPMSPGLPHVSVANLAEALSFLQAHCSRPTERNLPASSGTRP